MRDAGHVWDMDARDHSSSARMLRSKGWVSLDGHGNWRLLPDGISECEMRFASD